MFTFKLLTYVTEFNIAVSFNNQLIAERKKKQLIQERKNNLILLSTTQKVTN